MLDADAHEDFEKLLKFTAVENEKFSVEGLRCLYLAKGTIDQDTFNEWKELQNKAKVEGGENSE